MQKASNYKTSYTWLERAFLLLFALYLLYRAQYQTSFWLRWVLTDAFQYGFLCVLLGVSLLKVIFLILSDEPRRKNLLKLFLAAIPVSLIWFLVYRNDEFLFLAFLSVLTVGCIGTDYRKLLKIQVCAVGAIVLTAAICSFGGAIENLVYWTSSRRGNIRSSWGILYATDMAAYWFFLCLAGWMAWEKTPGWLFLVPGGLCLWISYEIAQSNTGVLSSVLFFLAVIWVCLLERKESPRVLGKIQKVINGLSCASFSVLGLLMVSLTWAYRQGSAFAQRVNQWNHMRLSLASAAYDNYGLHLLGYPFPLSGAGGSTFQSLGYNYVDCSYLQMLLRYGILIFVAFLLLWPLMTGTAARHRKHRLVLGLALIAFHAVSEQRFLDVDYNVFLAAPFSVLSMGLLQEEEKTIPCPERSSPRAGRIAAVCTALLASVTVFLFWKPMLSWFRTIVTVTQVWFSDQQRLFLLFASLSFLAGVVLVIRLLGRILQALLDHRRPEKWQIGLLVGIFAAAAGVFVHGERRLDRAMDEYADVIAADRAVIEAAEGIDGLKLHIIDLPTLYDRQYGRHAVSLYNKDDLARLKNIAVIADSNWNSQILFKAGFQYAEISDSHAVYTDSGEMIEKLAEMGYSPGPFCSKKKEIPLKKLAPLNGLEYADDGGLYLSEDHILDYVRDIHLHRGIYAFTFDLSLLPHEPAFSEETPVLLVRLTGYYSKWTFLEQAITRSQFDKDGHLLLEVSAEIDASDVEFHLIPKNGAELELYSAAYRGVG